MEITIVTCDSGDWEGVYYNNSIMEQGHTVPLWMFLELLDKVGVLKYKRITLRDSYLEELGNLPEKLSDLDV